MEAVAPTAAATTLEVPVEAAATTTAATLEVPVEA